VLTTAGKCKRGRITSRLHSYSLLVLVEPLEKLALHLIVDVNKISCQYLQLLCLTLTAQPAYGELRKIDDNRETNSSGTQQLHLLHSGRSDKQQHVFPWNSADTSFEYYVFATPWLLPLQRRVQLHGCGRVRDSESTSIA
jgi:hypothetical protein